MKLFQCDICKQEISEHDSLSTLYTKYQSEGIQHVCGGCDKELSNIRYALDKAVNDLKTGWMKKIIRRMAGKNKADSAIY